MKNLEITKNMRSSLRLTAPNRKLICCLHSIHIYARISNSNEINVMISILFNFIFWITVKHSKIVTYRCHLLDQTKMVIAKLNNCFSLQWKYFLSILFILKTVNRVHHSLWSNWIIPVEMKRPVVRSVVCVCSAVLRVCSVCTWAWSVM